jgi:hypothetical protein
MDSESVSESNEDDEKHTRKVRKKHYMLKLKLPNIPRTLPTT